MTTTTSTLIELPLAQYPGIRPFALDLVTGNPRVSRFSARLEEGSRMPRPAAIDRVPVARSLAESNRRWGNDVDAELERWERGDTVVVAGGQQVGFAGGPLLTLTKIASLLRIKRDLELSGVPATAMFWMATEDHDFGEVACLDWPRRDGGLGSFRCPHPSNLNRPVGSLPIPEILIQHYLEVSGATRERWLRDGVTFGESFAELVAEVVRGKGLVLVDSMDPALRRAGAPLFVRLVASMPDVENAIRARSEELSGAGYEPQVVPNPEGGYSVLYVVRDGERLPLRRAGEGWTLGAASLSGSEAVALVTGSPETVSTGALARPLLQDYALQPSVFVGGPAEVAYYAQILPLHEMLGIEPPHVALRGHVLLAPEKLFRAMEKHGVAPPELVSPPEEILSRREEPAMRTLHEQVATLAQRIDDAMSPIRKTVAGADPAMEKSLARTLKRVRYHLGKIEERGGRAILRRDAERHRAIHRLCGTLFPAGVPQDRKSAWAGYWSTYGEAMIERLIGVVRPDSASFHITGV